MKKIIVLTLACGLVFGCTNNPTNEPSASDINTAVDRKLKAIDDDPSMTPEQKAEMKKHISGPVGSGSTNTR